MLAPEAFFIRRIGILTACRDLDDRRSLLRERILARRSDTLLGTLDQIDYKLAAIDQIHLHHANMSIR